MAYIYIYLQNQLVQAVSSEPPTVTTVIISISTPHNCIFFLHSIIKTIEILRTYPFVLGLNHLWLLFKWLHGDEKNLVSWIVLKALLHIIAFLASGRHFGDPFLLPWGSSLPRIPVHDQDDIIFDHRRSPYTFTFATLTGRGPHTCHWSFVHKFMGGFSSIVVGWTHPGPKSNLTPDFETRQFIRKRQLALEDRLNYHTQLTFWVENRHEFQEPKVVFTKKPWEGLAASFQQSRSFRSDCVNPKKKTWQRPQGDKINVCH